MNILKIIVVGALIVLIACSGKILESCEETVETPFFINNGSSGFAVVELFTSEGCSSCPPADELLGKLQQAYDGKPVYALAYHVDYWDRLGWKDPFSDVRFTNRQHEYSQFLGSQLYTPQAVVNGKVVLVGSDKQSLNAAVNKNLAAGQKQRLSLDATIADENLVIHYESTPNLTDVGLKIALVQKKAVSNVKRGENEGRKLTHFQIVHKLYAFKVDSDGKGSKEFTLPKNFNTTDWEIIGMLQSQETGVIVGASRAVLAIE